MSVCVWMGCGDWKWPESPERAISVFTRREATISTILPRKIIFFVVEQVWPDVNASPVTFDPTDRS